MKTVLSVGETLWDLLPSGPVLGGAPCNLAYRVTSLGDRGVLATRLGQDELGKKARERLAQLGMDLRHVQLDDGHPTGTVPVKVDEKGVPDFTIVKQVAYDYLQATDELVELAAGADCIAFGSLAQRSVESRRAIYHLLDAGSRAVKFLDLNLRKDCFTKGTVGESLRRADVLKLNEGEAEYLREFMGIAARTTDEIVRALIERWALSCVVVTLGERGALAVTAAERVYQPGWKVDVVDTCGSGDAFSGGFLHEYLRQAPLARCCLRGNALGAIVATQPGATGPVTAEELDRFLGSPPPEIRDPALHA